LVAVEPVFQLHPVAHPYHGVNRSGLLAVALSDHVVERFLVLQGESVWLMRLLLVVLVRYHHLRACRRKSKSGKIGVYPRARLVWIHRCLTVRRRLCFYVALGNSA